MGNEVSNKKNSPKRKYEETVENCWHSVWSKIIECDVKHWTESLAEHYGFDLYENWFHQNLQVQKKPWSAFQVRGKLPEVLKKKGEKNILCTFTCEILETGREEKIKWWIKDASVLAVNQDTVMVQLVVSGAVKILFVNTYTGFLRCTYTFNYLEEPCIQEGFLSPCSNFAALRQNIQLRKCFGHYRNIDPNIRILQIKDGICQRIYFIEDILVISHFGSGLSFVPNSDDCKLTVVSSENQCLNPDFGIYTCNVESHEIVQSAECSTNKAIHHIKYSPSGQLIAVLCVNFYVNLSSSLNLDAVQILGATKFEVLHEIEFADNIPPKPLYLLAFPMFSRNGNCVAMMEAKRLNENVVSVYKLPGHGLSLAGFCRSVILYHVSYRFLNDLPLPSEIIRYLKFC